MIRKGPLTVIRRAKHWYRESRTLHTFLGLFPLEFVFFPTSLDKTPSPFSGSVETLATVTPTGFVQTGALTTVKADLHGAFLSHATS